MTDLKRYRLDCADGEWTPYDEAEAALLQARSDAAAAQAVMVEQCQEAAETWYAETFEGDPVLLGHVFDALAPDAGTAELAKLRGERDALLDAVQANMLRPDYLRAERAEAERDRLADELTAANAREAVDADLLLAAYKAMLVLHRVLDKSGLTAGAETANQITDRIVAAHPEMPGRASLRTALAQPGTEGGE